MWLSWCTDGIGMIFSCLLCKKMVYIVRPCFELCKRKLIKNVVTTMPFGFPKDYASMIVLTY